MAIPSYPYRLTNAFNYLDLLKKTKHTMIYGHIPTTLEAEFMFDNMVRASDVPNVKYILCKMTV